jgi:hypothetical protein
MVTKSSRSIHGRKAANTMQRPGSTVSLPSCSLLSVMALRIELCTTRLSAGVWTTRPRVPLKVGHLGVEPRPSCSRRIGTGTSQPPVFPRIGVVLARSQSHFFTASECDGHFDEATVVSRTLATCRWPARPTGGLALNAPRLHRPSAGLHLPPVWLGKARCLR